jgi:AcrR family transcriptional regulator
MALAEDRRDAIVEHLADFVLDHGLDAANLRAMARACGTSDRMLLYYFPDKERLLAAVFERIAGRITAMMDAAAPPQPLPPAALRDALVPLLLDQGVWPYMRVWLAMASRAAHGDPLCRTVGEQLGRGFLAWAKAHVEEPDEASRDREAGKILTVIEGLVLLKALGLNDVVDGVGSAE